MHKFAQKLGLLGYTEYMDKFRYWAENMGSSMPEASPAIVEFTRLNWARTQRLHKTLEIDESLRTKIQSLKHQYSWLVITEAWCGDSAQSLPYIAELFKSAAETSSFFILFRDENPGLMDQYLTNGSRAIPKLIVIDETTQKEVFVWGPRPIPAQEIVLQWKANPNGRSWDQLEKELHSWYTKNKGVSLQKELSDMLDILIQKENSPENTSINHDRHAISFRA